MRWRIIVRSNSAKAPVSWNTSLPIGVVVSMACWSRYKSTPQASRCWMVSSKSLSERPKRSNRPCHDDIELPPASVLEHGVEARPSVSPLGAGDARIAVDLHDVPTTPPGDLPKLADLIFDRLCVRADSHVQRRALRA